MGNMILSKTVSLLSSVLAAFAPLKTPEISHIFGIRPMDPDSTLLNLLSKSRAFLQFLLEAGTYDNGLLVIHTHYPRGDIAMQTGAV